MEKLCDKNPLLGVSLVVERGVGDFLVGFLPEIRVFSNLAPFPWEHEHEFWFAVVTVNVRAPSLFCEALESSGGRGYGDRIRAQSQGVAGRG